ncbi:formyltetrahydrofolate deformylase [Catenovulum maritimum]|uniref:Formyltetrahydrofolate deformylase n=1 Tax=Catenovulum maritimum TaxID=1513271 RepID=A0A0J8GTS0_9ALTE|nr:formyltetrahydrofolate deformylase [Catenovulum maritimum]KMT66137.1 formyltetrahydrofolate deformylase [Catenovulum maritimum]
MKSYRLMIDCPDQVGIVAAVSQFLAEKNASIVEANHHTDRDAKWFFMRHEIQADSISLSLDEFKTAFAVLAEQFNMNWRVVDSSTKQNVVLLASRESHCLADLLHRWHSGELDCNIVAVIANHDHLRQMVQWHGIPYHHVIFDKENKQVAFDEIKELVHQYSADTIVLARFMQIFPDELCQEFAGRVINIHHSFLPSFAGAKPYHQAHQRGVKLIGATCHYVTAELDAGPIIDQEIVRISHRDTVEDMVRKGKDCEKSALARGLRNHIEDRVTIIGNKTVVFD